MARLPIRWICARAYGHATEDEDRVARSLDAVCPSGGDRRETLEGQYGNPILQLARRVDESGAVRKIWEHWRSSGILAAILPDLDARIDDEGVLHFRVDKQRAFGGVLALARGEDFVDVAVKLEAYPARPEEIRRVARHVVAEAR